MSATFNREWDDIDSKFLEGIYSGDTDLILSSMINRNIREQDNYGRQMAFDVRTEGKSKVNATDAIRYGASFSYVSKHSTEDQLITLNYNADPKPTLNDRRHCDIEPDFNWSEKEPWDTSWRWQKTSMRTYPTHTIAVTAIPSLGSTGRKNIRKSNVSKS